MSEKAKETKEAPEGKKKKGKLPIIIVLALVLGGGGFFGMKMRGGSAPKKEPPIELGAIVEIKDEFLSNMAERDSYVRAKISLQFAKDFKAEHLEADMAAIQDVINMKFQGTSVRSVSTLDGLRKFKQELAANINKLLKETEHKEGKEPEKAAPKEGSEPAKGAAKEEKGKPKPEKDAASFHDDWDSQTGPVLKVLFVSFATQ